MFGYMCFLDCLRTFVSSVLKRFNICLSIISFRMVVVEEKDCSYGQYSLLNVPQS